MSTFIDGPVGSLETLAEGFDDPFNGIAIVCHPHPLHGGTMHNKVVHYVARTMREMGLASLRFNYRGVGESKGEYAEGIGETDDLLAVIDWVEDHFPGLPIWLGGFSFGCYVSLRATCQRKIDQLVSVAPPVHSFDFTQLALPDCPWLLIQGDEDEVVPFQSVVDWVNSLPTPPATAYLEGVSHFFHGKLPLLRQTLLDNLSDAAAKL